MEINFFQNGNYYVAEFEVKTDFNLHIERDSGRKLYIYQCTSGGGDYALVNDFCNNNNQNVIDIDFTALVYPKRIKIVSDAEPTYATVVTDGEVTEIKTQSTMEYWDVSRLDEEFAKRCDNVAYFMKVRDVDNVLIGPKGLQMEYNQLLAIAIDVKAMLFCAQGMSFNAIQFLQMNYGYTADQIAAIPRITEEEFYNLDNVASLIKFTVDGTSYQAEEGMTWQDFVDSSYNDGDVVINKGYVNYGGARIDNEGSTVLASDVIVNGCTYNRQPM